MKTRTMRIEVPDEDIRLMYEDGLSTWKIAEAIGTTQHTVYRQLVCLGVPRRQRTHKPDPQVARELCW